MLFVAILIFSCLNKRVRVFIYNLKKAVDEFFRHEEVVLEIIFVHQKSFEEAIL